MHKFMASNGDLHVFSNAQGSFRPLQTFVGTHYLKIGDEEHQFIDLDGVISRFDKQIQPISFIFRFEEDTAKRIRELIVASLMSVMGMNLLQPSEENLKFMRSCENLLRRYTITDITELKRVEFVVKRYSDVDRNVNMKFEHIDSDSLKVTWTSTLNGEEKNFVLRPYSSYPFSSNCALKDDDVFHEMCEMLKRKLGFICRQQAFDEIPDETIQFLQGSRGLWPEIYEIERGLSWFINEIHKKNLKLDEPKTFGF